LADKERYTEEMESYSPPPKEAGEKKAKKPKKDPNAPKRAQVYLSLVHFNLLVLQPLFEVPFH
jgi:hypothetical protein